MEERLNKGLDGNAGDTEVKLVLSSCAHPRCSHSCRLCACNSEHSGRCNQSSQPAGGDGLFSATAERTNKAKSSKKNDDDMMVNWKRRSILDGKTLTVNFDHKAKENGRKRKLAESS